MKRVINKEACKKGGLEIGKRVRVYFPSCSAELALDGVVGYVADNHATFFFNDKSSFLAKYKGRFTADGFTDVYKYSYAVAFASEWLWEEVSEEEKAWKELGGGVRMKVSEIK